MKIMINASPSLKDEKTKTNYGPIKETCPGLRFSSMFEPYCIEGIAVEVYPRKFPQLMHG
jgi:hypothetical protein